MAKGENGDVAGNGKMKTKQYEKKLYLQGGPPNAFPNPPHTTDGKITAPKFGSAGSGGAELEPGPPRP